MLLLLCSKFQDAVAKERIVHRHDDAMRGIHLANLLHGKYISHRVHSRSAVLFRYLDAHKPHFPHLPDGLVGEFAAFIKLAGDGSDLSLREIVGQNPVSFCVPHLEEIANCSYLLRGTKYYFFAGVHLPFCIILPNYTV